MKTDSNENEEKAIAVLNSDFVQWVVETIDKVCMTKISGAYVPDSDIAEIELNEKVNVKMSAYPYNDYGMFQGKVIEIGDISV